MESPKHENLNQSVFVLAISSRGRSRIGTNPVPAVVEQSHKDKIFITFPGKNQCRWILAENDPDFQVITELEP